MTNHWRLFRKRREGRAQSTLEFAFITWPIFLLLLGATDYAQFYYYEHSLHYALNVAGRYATPGGVVGAPASAANGATNCPTNSQYTNGWISRNESVRRAFSNTCVLNLPINTLKVQSWPGTNNATETSPNVGPGIASDWVKLTANYPIKLITPVANLLTPNGIYNITVTGIFLNEPSGNFNIYKDRYPNEPQ